MPTHLYVLLLAVSVPVCLAFHVHGGSLGITSLCVRSFSRFSSPAAAAIVCAERRIFGTFACPFLAMHV